jgi:cysteinyl-tRNA synthetase
MGYEANGSVYFDVVKFNKTNHYGRLRSGRNIEYALIHVILMDNLIKRNPQDFLPYGKSGTLTLYDGLRRGVMAFSGWHLECTAMY